MRGSYYESDSESDFDLGEDEYRYGDFPGYVVRMNYDDLDLEDMYATALDEYNNRTEEASSAPIMMDYYDPNNPALSEHLYNRSIRPLGFSDPHSESYEGALHASDLCLLATNVASLFYKSNVYAIYDYQYDFMKVSKLWLHREMLGRSKVALERELIEAVYHPRKMLAWVMAGNDPETYLN